MVPVKLSPAPARGGLSIRSCGGGGGGGDSSGGGSLVLWLSSVTGILGWIIRITLLLLKNTRSRGEYQRQAGSGRPSQPTSWTLKACGCQGSTFFFIFSFPWCLRSRSRVWWFQDTSQRAAPLATGLQNGRAQGARAEGDGGGETAGRGVCPEEPEGSSVSGVCRRLSRRDAARGETRTRSLKLGMIERPWAVWQRRKWGAELGRGWLGAASAERACLRAKVPPQAAEARDFANPGPGRR